MPKSIFDHTHSIITETTFTSPKFAPTCKTFILSIHSWDTVDFRALPCDQTGQTHFGPCLPKHFKQLLIHVNLCQHVKIQDYFNLTGWEHFDPYLRKKN